MKNIEKRSSTGENISLKEGKKHSWEKIDKLILGAFKKIETEHPFQPVTVKELRKKLKKEMSRKTIYNHIFGLKPPQITRIKSGLIERGLIVNVGRGLYSSKIVTISKKLAQRFIIGEEYDQKPQVHEFKKALKLFKDSSFKDEHKFHKQLAFVKKNTEINIFSKNYFNTFQKQAVSQKVLDLIFELLTERIKDYYEDVSFNIIISYNPQNIETEPSKQNQDLNLFDDKVTNEDLLQHHRWVKQHNDDRKRIQQRKRDERLK